MSDEVGPRLLTVGDGDCSYSVALMRAYGKGVRLTCTTLLSREELSQTYSSAAAAIMELEAQGVRVVHGVDATALDIEQLGPQDHILFTHPHLGLADLLDVQAHSQRHQILVAHYLQSAAALLAPGGKISLTLCGNQPSAWRVIEHATRVGLSPPTYVDVAAAPPCVGAAPLVPAPPLEAWAARRRFRSGALGARHWLARYGYEHRRSEGDLDMRVDRSVEIVWEVPAVAHANEQGPSSSPSFGFFCAVCGYSFADAEECARHLSLGRPAEVGELRAWRAAQEKRGERVGQSAAGLGGSADAPTGVDKAEGAAEVHACLHCGSQFVSRNGLFRHLSKGCDPSARGKPDVERFALLVGYVGEGLHGASANAEDETRPTVCGTLVAAARRVWRPANPNAGEEGANGAASSTGSFCATPLVRTERGVGALYNWVIFSASGVGLDAVPPRERLRGLATALEGSGVRIMNPGAAAGLDGASADLRHAAHRLVYRLAVPYRLLVDPSVDVDASASPAAIGPTGTDARNACTVWLSGLSDDFRSESDVRVLIDSAGVPPCASISWPDCGGYAEIEFDERAKGARCVAVLDGLAHGTHGGRLIALFGDEARVKLAVHQRVKAAMRRLVEGDPPHDDVQGRRAKTQKRRARSFHNFVSHKARLRGVSDQGSVLLLQRCYSGVQDDLRGEGGADGVGAEECRACGGGEWLNSDCVLMAFAARDFAPQQVRRMGGAIAAVVSGRRPSEYIDRCFSEADVHTPLAPAESMFLEQVEVSPRARSAWAAHLPSAGACALARGRHGEAGAGQPAGAQLPQSAVAVLEECASVRQHVLGAARRAACAAATQGWLDVEEQEAQHGKPQT
jgi:tRNA U38,U39,U40 pseudouridine synthase TruA